MLSYHSRRFHRTSTLSSITGIDMPDTVTPVAVTVGSGFAAGTTGSVIYVPIVLPHRPHFYRW